MSYRLLALDPNSQHMSLSVLRKIRDLVNAGAAVVGAKPQESPSLSDNQAEFRTIADQVWGSLPARARSMPTRPWRKHLLAMQVAPDFEYSKPQADTNLLFVHRKLPDGEIYWVNNRANRKENLDATFRVTGKAAEIWHPETGKTEPASIRLQADTRRSRCGWSRPTRCSWSSARRPLRHRARVPARVETALATVDGPWDVSFQPDRGAPARDHASTA